MIKPILSRPLLFAATFGIGLIAVSVLLKPSQSPEIPEVTVQPLQPKGDLEIVKAEASDGKEKTLDSYSDRSHIGRPGKNKVEIRCFERGNKLFTEIQFFTLSNSNKWKPKQSFEFTKDFLTDCEPKISDFNNDGLKDLTYHSAVAARGANVVRKLFIYDKKRDKLVYIKNSEDYPNMLYNKRLKCIDAFLFAGTTWTVFLKLEGDELREIASVSNGLERVAEVFDKNGKSHVLSRKKMTDKDDYTRYMGYDPVAPYR